MQTLAVIAAVVLLILFLAGVVSWLWPAIAGAIAILLLVL